MPIAHRSATRSGATAASEQAVEEALDWLARHQDADGRWDGATARDEDGTALPGDDDFTVFCPPGQTCFGECAYWEADTALTGLALLTYLGAGYTHQDGKFATTVSKGLDFLLSQQKADGDLRGQSRAVGMYCHAMATLALCEAYALSLEDRLREPAERAVAFLIRGRARDGQAWRYLAGATVGDTSILGWVVMALKSAREVGLRMPDLPQLDQRHAAVARPRGYRAGKGAGAVPAMGARDPDDDRRSLGLPPVSRSGRTRGREHRGRQLPAPAPIGQGRLELTITGTTARWPCISTVASPGPGGMAGSATGSSAFSALPGIPPEAGIPTTAFTEPGAAGSTARLSPRFPWRSTTATSGSTTSPSCRPTPRPASRLAQLSRHRRPR